MYSLVTIINKLAYLQVAKRVDLTSPHHREKNVLTIYANILTALVIISHHI